jgi:selenocysteine lyase/cysteine desulfurase
VAVTWVHSSTGVKLPIRRIAEALGPNRPVLCVDGIHGFGADATPVAELGCDVFVSGCHKWLFGPRGTGLVWARPAAWARIEPTIPTFDVSGFAAWFGRPAEGPPAPGARMTPGGYHSFEHRWALAEAFQLHLDIGPKRVAERTAELAGALKDGLAGMSHVRLATPRDPALSAGIVCCTIGNRPPFDVVPHLRERFKVAATVTPYTQPLVRFGPGIANSDDDVTAVLDAVRKLA